MNTQTPTCNYPCPVFNLIKRKDLGYCKFRSMCRRKQRNKCIFYNIKLGMEQDNLDKKEKRKGNNIDILLESGGRGGKSSTSSKDVLKV